MLWFCWTTQRLKVFIYFISVSQRESDIVRELQVCKSVFSRMPPKLKRRTKVPAAQRFFDLQSQKSQIVRLEHSLGKLLSYSESDSVILCGPPGSGKSAIVEQALTSFRSDGSWKEFRCIYLHGQIEGDLKSSVDRFLFELGADTKKNGMVIGSAAEKLRELCDCFKDVSKKSEIKGIILIIDNLEQFIIQNNQTLLYNIFDAAQQNKLAICIIAISSVMEVLEKMEKRVKSRFSQQVLVVSKELFRDFEEFIEAFLFICTKYWPDISNCTSIQSTCIFFGWYRENITYL